ncbi:hypothetical protein EW028_24365, partial [Lysinibacillus sp. OL1]
QKVPDAQTAGHCEWIGEERLLPRVGRCARPSRIAACLLRCLHCSREDKSQLRQRRRNARHPCTRHASPPTPRLRAAPGSSPSGRRSDCQRLTDSCGLHFMDGYWPAVRFNGDDGVIEVTVES